MTEKLIFHGREHERNDGMYYMSVRAISAIVNLNYDGWPSDELEASYKTFIGDPVFVDHHSEDNKRSRGVILDAEFLRTDSDAWIDLLLEIDAEAFPMLAHELKTGGLDSVSMGAYVETVECSICGEINPGQDGSCSHIPGMKGMMVGDELVYEVCRDITFYEISLVFDPADVTAIAKNVVAHNEMVTHMPNSKESAIGTGGPFPNSYKVDLSPYGRGSQVDVVEVFPFSHTNEGEGEYDEIFDVNPYARVFIDDLFEPQD